MFDFEYVEIEWFQVLIVIAVTVLILAAAYFAVTILQRKRGVGGSFSTKDLTYAAICIAIAYALSFFGYRLPNGGTVTAFSTVPIIIYCYYFGFRKGLAACTVFMLLQLLQNPSIIHPFSIVLDYVLPYMFLSITGIFMYRQKRAAKAKNPFAMHYPVYIGSVIYIALRYASHVISGVVFWHIYRWEGYTLLGYSMAYNSFVLIDFAVSMVALASLLASKSFNTFMASHGNTLQNANAGAKNNQ